MVTPGPEVLSSPTLPIPAVSIKELIQVQSMEELITVTEASPAPLIFHTSVASNVGFLSKVDAVDTPNLVEKVDEPTPARNRGSMDQVFEHNAHTSPEDWLCESSKDEERALALAWPQPDIPDSSKHSKLGISLVNGHKSHTSLEEGVSSMLDEHKGITKQYVLKSPRILKRVINNEARDSALFCSNASPLLRKNVALGHICTHGNIDDLPKPGSASSMNQKKCSSRVKGKDFEAKLSLKIASISDDAIKEKTAVDRLSGRNVYLDSHAELVESGLLVQSHEPEKLVSSGDEDAAEDQQLDSQGFVPPLVVLEAPVEEVVSKTQLVTLTEEWARVDDQEDSTDCLKLADHNPIGSDICVDVQAGESLLVQEERVVEGFLMSSVQNLDDGSDRDFPGDASDCGEEFQAGNSIIEVCREEGGYPKSQRVPEEIDANDSNKHIQAVKSGDTANLKDARQHQTNKTSPPPPIRVKESHPRVSTGELVGLLEGLRLGQVSLQEELLTQVSNLNQSLGQLDESSRDQLTRLDVKVTDLHEKMRQNALDMEHVINSVDNLSFDQANNDLNSSTRKMKFPQANTKSPIVPRSSRLPVSILHAYRCQCEKIPN